RRGEAQGGRRQELRRGGALPDQPLIQTRPRRSERIDPSARPGRPGAGFFVAHEKRRGKPVDQIRKAMDSLLGANYERKDLSALISIQDGPVRPLLQGQTIRAGTTVPMIGEVPAKGKTHYWNEQPLAAPT